MTTSPDIQPAPSPLCQAEADALIRAEFAALRGSYLDVAARGPLPASAGQDSMSVLRAQMEGTVAKDEWFALVDSVRAQVAELRVCFTLGARWPELRALS